MERRKEWLTQWLEHRREQRDQGLDESLLYAEQMDNISYSDFVNKELILFSNMDNERSIPSSVDGEFWPLQNPVKIWSAQSAIELFFPHSMHLGKLEYKLCPAYQSSC